MVFLRLQGRSLDSAEGIRDISAASMLSDPVVYVIRHHVFMHAALGCASASLIRCFDGFHKNPLIRDAVGLKII